MPSGAPHRRPCELPGTKRRLPGACSPVATTSPSQSPRPPPATLPEGAGGLPPALGRRSGPPHQQGLTSPGPATRLEPPGKELVLHLEVVPLVYLRLERLVQDHVARVVLDVLPAGIAVTGEKGASREEPASRWRARRPAATPHCQTPSLLVTAPSPQLPRPVGAFPRLATSLPPDSRRDAPTKSKGT